MHIWVQTEDKARFGEVAEAGKEVPALRGGECPLLVFVLLVTEGVPRQCENARCRDANAEHAANKD